MGWLDFLKDRTKTEDKPKTISFDVAETLIENELKKRDNEILLIKSIINIRADKFISDLEKQIKILKNITLEERKENEKLKFVVLENLYSYIDDTWKLANNLKKIDYEVNIEFIFKGINIEIEAFNKNSQRKLAKTAILVGNELSKSEEIIKLFYKDIEKIAEGNKKTIGKGEEIKKLDGLKQSFLELNKVYKDISKEVDDLKKEDEKLKDGKNKIGKDLMFFKKSEEHISFIEQKSKLKQDIENLEEDVKLLKTKIDFKSLLNKFHEIERVRELIKNYRDNFLKTLECDKEFEIIELLGHSQKDLDEEIKNISKRNVSLKKSEEEVVERKLDEFASSIREKDFEILNICNKIEGENKKLKRFNENKNTLQNEIKTAMNNLLEGIEII